MGAFGTGLVGEETPRLTAASQLVAVSPPTSAVRGQLTSVLTSDLWPEGK